MAPKCSIDELHSTVDIVERARRLLTPDVLARIVAGRPAGPTRAASAGTQARERPTWTSAPWSSSSGTGRR